MEEEYVSSGDSTKANFDGDSIVEKSQGSSKRRKLGMHKYVNSASLSDVDIRFGAESEQVVHAHRIVLCAKSTWFENAFTGNFMESNAREITLHEDDPVHVRAMLESAYTDEIRFANPSDHFNNALFCVGMYCVVDKYDFQSLQLKVKTAFEHELTRWLVSSRTSELRRTPQTMNEFCSIVSRVYDLPMADIRHPIIKTLLGRVITNRGYVDIANKSINGEKSLAMGAAEIVPEFGRDAFIRLMGQGSQHTDINGSVIAETQVREATMVYCRHCKNKWLTVLTEEYHDDGYCYKCGKHQIDWNWCTMLPRPPPPPTA